MSNADGVVIIEAEMETKGIDKGIASIEAKMEKLRKKAEQPYTIDVDGRNIEVAGDWNLSKEEQQYYDRLQASLNKLQLQKTEMLMTDNQITQNIGEQAEKQEEISSSLNKWVDGVMQIADDLYVVKKDTSEISDEAKKINLNFDNIGKSMNNIVKKAVKWSLAVFGIRSAFMFVRSAINTIAGDDEQLKADIDYMKNAIAYTLEPVVRGIVNLAKQLMFYVGYIVKAWTSRNIFENANKSLQNANKNAKALSKTMAGFDEMNVLSDTSSSSGGATAPSFDLSKPENIEPPAWLVWIANNKDVILSTLAGIAASIITIKLGLTSIQALGIGATIAGITFAIMSLLNYLKDPTWSNFGNTIIGIGIAVTGLGIAFLGLPAVITGVVLIILGMLAKFWDKINEFLENLVSNIFTKGDDIMNWLHDNFGIIGDILNVIVGTVIGAVTSVINAIRHLFDGLFTGVRQILDGIILMFKGNFKEGIISVFKGIANIIIGVLNVLIDGLNAVISPIRGLIVAVGKVMGKGWTMEDIKIPNIPKLAKGGIINMPGRGVPVGSAIGGERGQEGVIPLTDSQQMELLGEAIGKYININATIPVYVGNRQITREIRKINAEDDFAYNR